MESILIYIIQVNLLLSLLYLGYCLLLKKLTFYGLNRGYFIFGSLYSFFYPFIDFKNWFSSTVELPQGIVLSYLPFNVMEQDILFSVQDFFILILAIGSVLFMLKFILQFFSLARIHRNSTPDTWNNYLYRNVAFSIVPFSFFKTIYLHINKHHEFELQDIFKHEYIHVKGLHTFDKLLLEIITISCWFNPLIWFMRRAVSQNLEYFTDQKVLEMGIDRQAYQYSLLNVSSQGEVLGLGNQFNFKTLKKRIMMMNKKRSSKLELGKYGILLPVLILTGITFTANHAEAKIEQVMVNMSETDLNQVIKLSVEQKDIQSKQSQADGNQINQVLIRENLALDSAKVIENGNKSEVRSVQILANKPENIRKQDTVKNRKSLGDLKPLVVLDDQTMPKDYTMSDVDPNQLESIRVIKDKTAAVELYGDDAKDGVIILETKVFASSSKGKKFENRDGLQQVDDKILKNATYFIDDKQVDKEVVDQLDPNSIEDFSVLKNKTETDIPYGKEKYGVVKIRTKKQVNKAIQKLDSEQKTEKNKEEKEPK